MTVYIMRFYYRKNCQAFISATTSISFPNPPL